MNEQTIPTQEPSFAEDHPVTDETIETEADTQVQDESLDEEEEIEEELIIEDFTIDGICGVY